MEGYYEGEVPTVSTLKHTSHTLTGLLRLYLIMGMSLVEHLPQRILPQCRLQNKNNLSAVFSKPIFELS